MIVTIGRKYGSVGRMTGEKLAKLLNYRFYDRELLKIAARDIGMHEDVVQNFDEKPAGSLLYSTYLHATLATTDALPLNQKLAFAQFDVIRRVAQDGDCVIIGRCADYVLQGRQDCFNVFVTASDEVRSQRLVQYYGVPEDLVEKVIKKQDKQRAEYYNFFTHRKWGSGSTYDLCLDAGRFTLDGAAELLANAVRQLEQAAKT